MEYTIQDFKKQRLILKREIRKNKERIKIMKVFGKGLIDFEEMLYLISLVEPIKYNF
jgi:hypothetical protein